MVFLKVILKKVISERRKRKLSKQIKYKKVVAKPQEKHSVARWQLQAINRLASGVNKMKCKTTEHGRKRSRSTASVRKKGAERNCIPVKKCTISSL